jgi:hypothetical protein
MSQSPVLVEIGDDFVADITLNRPDQLNTFTFDLARELIRVMHQLDADDPVRVMVIKGAGRAFCAGIDISFLPDRTTVEYQQWIECMTAPDSTSCSMRTRHGAGPLLPCCCPAHGRIWVTPRPRPGSLRSPPELASGHLTTASR